MSDEAKPNVGASDDALHVFPEWHNRIPRIIFGVAGPLATVLVVLGVWYYFSPRNTDVGYRPHQPIPYSHKLHVGDLGMDCRYCHVGVERSAVAGVPPVQTCMNCHQTVKKDSPVLAPLRQAWEKNEPVKWVRVHKTPDYAYFDHSAHVNAAIGCETCHGRIDQMVEVTQRQPLNMEWCVDCHREPEMKLRPTEHVTTMGFDSQKHLSTNQLTLGRRIQAEKKIYPPIHCSGCHR